MYGILILEDDTNRIDIFKECIPRCRVVTTVEQFIEIVNKNQKWRQIWLDHDLGGEVYCDSNREDTGMEAVRHILSMHSPLLRKTEFIIHSWNPSGALSMKTELEKAGYNVIRQPFNPGLFR